MAKIGDPKQAKAFDTFMNYNTALHGVMADIASASKNEDVVSLKGVWLQDALNIITNAMKLTDQFPKLKAFGDQIAAWSKALDKVMAMYPIDDDGTILMPSGVAVELNAKVLNQIANLVHDAAIEMAGKSSVFKACKVISFKPDEAAFVGNYCAGVVPMAGEALVHEVPMQKIKIQGKDKILQYPTQIEHALGCHRVKPSSLTSDNEIQLAIEYRESGPHYKGSFNRMKGVHQRMEKEGFECSLGNKGGSDYHNETHLYCWGKKKPEEIQQLGTYFSLLLNGDIADMSTKPDYFEVVRDKAWEQAQKLQQQYGEDVWQKAPHQQVSWDSLYSQLQSDKELFKKKDVYENLRDLLILRDIHHQLEEIHHVTTGPVDSNVMKLIVDNANTFTALAKKAGLGVGDIPKQAGILSEYADKGYSVKIINISDAIGHIMHMLIADKLLKEGQYGGCQISGDIFNINAGNLSYCEGILQGTSGKLASAGNLILHKSLPNTYSVYIGDEEIAKGYNVLVTPPPDLPWTPEMVNHFKKLGFLCAPKQCNLVTADLEYIRRIGLLLSNLRGMGDKIGPECGAKAIVEATKAAGSQQTKGVFAWTQEPLMVGEKQWIDWCHKNFNILPPGLSAEEKAILSIIGPNKIYGGCTFAKSEVLPNLGVVKYCEGVRKNPTAAVNAVMDEMGVLAHLFHGEPGAPDKIANVTIQQDANLFQVSLSQIDLRDKQESKPFQKEVLATLKSYWGMNCPSLTMCETSHPISEHDLRRLASFLSSMHQAYNVQTSCVKPAVKYALDKATALPSSIKAHESIVYPFSNVDEWNKEVCSKVVSAAPAPTKPVQIEAGAEGAFELTQAYIKKLTMLPKGSNVGGCFAYIKEKPTMARVAYCAGIPALVTLLKNGEPIVIGKFTGSLSAGGVGHQSVIGYGMITFTSKQKELYISLPAGLLDLPGVEEHLTSPKQLGWQKKYTSTTDATFIQYVNPWHGINAAQTASFLARLAAIPKKWTKEQKKKAVDWAWEKANLKFQTPTYPFTEADWETWIKVMEEVAVQAAAPKLSNYESLSPNKKLTVKNYLETEIESGNAQAITSTASFFQLNPNSLLGLYDELKSKIPSAKAAALQHLLFTIVKEKGQPTLDQIVKAAIAKQGGWLKEGTKDEPGTIKSELKNLILGGEVAYMGGGKYTTMLPVKKAKTTPAALSDLLWDYLFAKEPNKWFSYTDEVAPFAKAWWDVDDDEIQKALDELHEKAKIKISTSGWKAVTEEGAHTYESLSKDEMDKVNNFILLLAQKGLDVNSILSKLKADLGLIASNALIDEIESQKGQQLVDWETLKSEVQLEFAKKVADAGISGWDELKKMALDSGIAPDEDTLPSIAELKHMAASEKPELSKKSFAKELAETQKEIKIAHAAMSGEVVQKGKDTPEYKKLPKQFKEWFHMVLKSFLLEQQLNQWTDDLLLANVQSWVKAIVEMKITPLMVQLQLGIEKKILQRKDILAVPDGEKVAKVIGDIPSASEEYQAILEYIEAETVSSVTFDYVLEQVMDKFGLSSSPELDNIVGNYFVSKLGKKKYSNLSKKELKEVHDAIIEYAQAGMNAYLITGNVTQGWNLIADKDLVSEIESVLALFPQKEDIELKGAVKALFGYVEVPEGAEVEEHIWEEEGEEEQANILKEIAVKVHAGQHPEDIIEEIASQFELNTTTGLMKAVYTTAADWLASVLQHHFQQGKSQQEADDLLTEAFSWVNQMSGYPKFLDEQWAKYYGKMLPLTPKILEGLVKDVLATNPGTQYTAGAIQNEIMKQKQYEMPSIQAIIFELKDLVEQGIIQTVGEGWWAYSEPQGDKDLIIAVLDIFSNHPQDELTLLEVEGLLEEFYPKQAITPLQIKEALDYLKSENKVVQVGDTYSKAKVLSGKGLEAWIKTLLGNNPKLLYSAEELYDAISEEGLWTPPDGIDILWTAKALAEKGEIHSEGTTPIMFQALPEVPKVEAATPGLSTFETIFANNPDKWLAAGDIPVYLTSEGYAVPSGYGIQQALDKLTNQGKLLWNLSENKFKWNPKQVEEKPLKAVEPVSGKNYKEVVLQALLDKGKLTVGSVKNLASEWGFPEGVMAETINTLMSEKAIHFYSKEQAYFLAGIKPEVSEAPKPPGMPEEMLDETITSFVKMGWTPSAIVSFLKDKQDEKKLKAKAAKLYDIYKPELRKVIWTYADLSPAIKGHMEQLAEKMLSEGKSTADTAWYLSHHFSTEKEAVREMVNKLAEKPLEQVGLAVKAFKLMGIGEKIGACKVSGTLENLMPQSVALCQGVLSPIGKTVKVELTDNGKKVKAEGDKQIISIASDLLDGDWQSKIIYVRDNAPNAEITNKEIATILSTLGMACEPMMKAGSHGSGYMLTECTAKGKGGMDLSVADQDKIRKAAIFLSLVETVPDLEDECIPKALEFAWNKSKAINQTEKPWTVYAYPHTLDEWNKAVCSKL